MYIVQDVILVLGRFSSTLIRSSLGIVFARSKAAPLKAKVLTKKLSPLSMSNGLAAKIGKYTNKIKRSAMIPRHVAVSRDFLFTMRLVPAMRKTVPAK